MLMALFQNKESLSSNKTTRVCGQADKNVQLQARPRGLIGVRRDFNLLLHPIVIRRLTADLPIRSISHIVSIVTISEYSSNTFNPPSNKIHSLHKTILYFRKILSF